MLLFVLSIYMNAASLIAHVFVETRKSSCKRTFRFSWMRNASALGAKTNKRILGPAIPQEQTHKKLQTWELLLFSVDELFPCNFCYSYIFLKCFVCLWSYFEFFYIICDLEWLRNTINGLFLILRINAWSGAK